MLSSIWHVQGGRFQRSGTLLCILLIEYLSKPRFLSLLTIPATATTKAYDHLQTPLSNVVTCVGVIFTETQLDSYSIKSSTSIVTGIVSHSQWSKGDDDDNDDDHPQALKFSLTVLPNQFRKEIS